MLKRSLHSRILFLIVGLIAVGVIISIYWENKNKEQELLDEKLRASRFMAQPILTAIYEDMLEERADMARHLINSLSKTKGIEGLYIVRSNGTEEAFKDFKTINDVKKEFGEVRPEWLTDHLDVKTNIAEGVQTDEFKSAFSSFRGNWNRGEVFYIDKTARDKPIFTYLLPIEKKAKCNTCHATEGARGILVIRTSLEDMYHILEKGRNQWIVSGVFAIAIGAILLSMLIKSNITGPIQKNVEVIKRIGEGRGDMSERVEVITENEIGYLAQAFNNMLDTLQKRAEENKKLFELVTKSKEEWVATFDAIHDLILIHDKEYRVLKINKALARKFNSTPEDLIGRRCDELLFKKSSHAGCPHERTLATGEVEDTEVDDLLFEGTYRVTTFPVFNHRGEVWASVHVARDITHEKMLREQLLHAEKLSSVGKLVAGIAHELNNPLMGIMGFSQILMDTPGDKKLDDIKDKLRKIYHESLRTAKIVQNLLTFARAKKTEREYHNINDILKHTVELREYSLKANNIQVVLVLDENLPRTMVDLFQLQQVFINIINNAEDAMVARKVRGRLEIKTAFNRKKIEIAFKDDGPGIPKDIIHKVFDPFFTTKDVGKGTGLGLSITHGIVTEHGGAIDIASPDEGGAIVTVELPVVEKEQWAEVKKAVETKVLTTSELTGRKVLVVDDEKSIRESLYSILTREGFKVETARDGREALDLLERNKVALLITDIKMPGYSGMDLHGSIMQKHEYLKDKIIVLTGDIFSQDVKEFLTKSNCPYILKPFEPKKLIDLINQVLV